MKIKDWAGRLIAATVLITVVRYMGAFAIADVGKITDPIVSDVLTFLLTLSGLGMGILDTLGGGLLFNGWRQVMPRSGDSWSFRFKVLTVCVFGLVISGMVILVPFTMARITQDSIVDVLGGKTSILLWGWAAMVNIIPYFLIAGVFIGNKMIEAETGAQVSEKVSHPAAKVTAKLSVDWRKYRPTLTLDQVRWIANSDPSVIVQALADSGYDLSHRSALNWRNNAREELGLINDSSGAHTE